MHTPIRCYEITMAMLRAEWYPFRPTINTEFRADIDSLHQVAT